jgi:hypothetical protein
MSAFVWNALASVERVCYRSRGRRPRGVFPGVAGPAFPVERAGVGAGPRLHSTRWWSEKPPQARDRVDPRRRRPIFPEARFARGIGASIHPCQRPSWADGHRHLHLRCRYAGAKSARGVSASAGGNAATSEATAPPSARADLPRRDPAPEPHPHRSGKGSRIPVRCRAALGRESSSCLLEEFPEAGIRGLVAQVV